MPISIDELTSPVTQNTQPDFNELGQSVTDYTTPEFMIFRFINVLIWVFSVAAIILFLYGGFVYATAGGDTEKAEKAKKIIIGTIIGVLIFSCSYLIYRTTIKVIGGSTQTQIKTENADEGYGSENDNTESDTSQSNSSGQLPTTRGNDTTNP